MIDESPNLIRYLYQNDFACFLEMAFNALHPGAEFQPHWSLDVLCEALARCESGECKRLIINMPPRSLKSFTASVALPAWALGRNPEAKVMCVAGHRGLADDQQEMSMRLLGHIKYRSIFPHVRTTESHAAIRLRQGGCRSVFTTTVSLTGRGADMIILDDPQRVGLDEADETRMAEATWAWYRRNVEQRLNNPREGVIIVVMQRLCCDDLTAKLLEVGEWEVLSIPMIAEDDERYPTQFGDRIVRAKNELLNPERLDSEQLQKVLKSVGARPFLAQYQQQPAEPGAHLDGAPELCKLPLELPEYLRGHFPGVGEHGFTVVFKDAEEELLQKYFGWEPDRYEAQRQLRHATKEEYRRIAYYEKLHDSGPEEAESWIGRFPETVEQDREWIAQQPPLPGLEPEYPN